MRGRQKFPALRLVVVAAGVGLRVPVGGAEGQLTAAAVTVRDVDLLPALSLSAPRLRSFLSLGSAERPGGEGGAHEAWRGARRGPLPGVALRRG